MDKNTKTRKKRTPIKTDNAPTPVSTNNKHSSRLDTLGINLNHNTARQAIILSEIIGKPVSKRRAHK